MTQKRTAFFVSDRTGITAEMFGSSLLTQFRSVMFERVTVPFVDNVDKAVSLIEQINNAREHDGGRPVVFSTLVNTDLSIRVARADALFIDCFNAFVPTLENELGVVASHEMGLSHSAGNVLEYHDRIEAINYTLGHDDGSSTRGLELADVILIGVSRSGKTPTCIYMALQFGVRAANYPLIPEDLAKLRLPTILDAHRQKVYGLTIDAERLQHIRTERRPGSEYASLDTCKREVRDAERLMRSEGVPYLNATSKSIEELATTILHQAKLVRHLY